MAKAKKKYKKRLVEKWGGRDLRGVINGKAVEVKLDPDTRTYYYNPPKLSGKGRKRKWLYSSKKRSAEEFLDIVEQHNRKQRRKELPRGTIEAERLLPNINQLPYEMDDEFAARKEYLLNEYMNGGIAQKEEETDDEYKERVLSNPHIPWRYKYTIPEQVLVAIFNEWLQDPYECSIKLGDERIAHLDKLAPKDQISMSKLAFYYFEYIPTDREQASEKERKKVKKWFEQFIKITGKTYLDDMNKAEIEKYTQTILKLAQTNKRSSTWVAHRYGAIRTVINTFARSLEDKTVPNRIIEWLKDYPAPSTKSLGTGKKFDPKPLTKKQWKELLTVVSDKETVARLKWKAIILFALNTCSYGVDCRDVRMENIDLSARTLTMFRKKKGAVPKCGVLWPETVEAIRAFQVKRKKHSAYVFPSRYGTQYTEGGFYDYWFGFIRPRLSWKFDFRQLRDAGRYGAECGSVTKNHIDIAMGHRLQGVDDNYLLRHPEQVEDVAEAIYQYYFGKQKKK